MTGVGALGGRYDQEVWDKVFCAQHWGGYPSEEFVRFMMRRYKFHDDRSKVTVLDLGCGGGANTWFLRREGFSVVSLDGSHAALAKAGALCAAEGYGYAAVQADFAALPFGRERFDVVAEVSSLQHNTFPHIRSIILQAHSLLKEGGIFFSYCLREGSCGFGQGEKVEDNTFFNIRNDLCKSKGVTHYFTRAELDLAYGMFGKLTIDETMRSADGGATVWKHWIVSAQK